MEKNSPRLLIPALGGLYGALAPITEPLIRAMAGMFLLAHGWPKFFGNMAGNAAFFEKAGFHPGLYWSIAVGLVECIGGICLALGLLTRLVSIPILIFLATAVHYHSGKGFYWNNLGFEYPLFWAIVVFHFLVRGGGPCSVDRWLGREI